MNTHPFASMPSPARAAAPITEFRGEYRFLSNFWPVPGGIRFGHMVGPSLEHVFQACKTTDEADRARILAADTAGQAKRLGGKVALRPDWETRKLGVMANLQAMKYRDPGLRERLLATGDAELFEGNRWGDLFWGIDATTGEGQNWLGRILMIQRSVSSVSYFD